MSEIKATIKNLQKRHAAVVERRNTLKGQLDAKKEELAELVKEIKEAGYDPKNLTQERDRIKKELEEMVETFEKSLKEVEQALENFNNK